MYGLSIHYLGDVDAARLAAFFAQAIAAGGGPAPVTFTTEPGPNTFPRLPVREGERVFAWLSRCPDEASMREARRRLDHCAGWREEAGAALLPGLMRKPERLRLVPTAAPRLG